MNKNIKVSLLRFEKNSAILLAENKDEIKWPKDKLPANLKMGDNFYLVANIRLDPNENQKELTKILLEEILNGEKK